jgi:hypothetical protein
LRVHRSGLPSEPLRRTPAVIVQRACHLPRPVVASTARAVDERLARLSAPPISRHVTGGHA